ncbi:GPI-N-acetylgalactosamine transferase PGAP4 isoform X2 [Ascaphus truei]|uniref:GPI-N-acetylgalactosamine transferase PGAP4 isoform X2 n=1 Tax=Ascaphus truei TaxID=8439 RepID=UPI003F59E196
MLEGQTLKQQAAMLEGQTLKQQAAMLEGEYHSRSVVLTRAGGSGLEDCSERVTGADAGTETPRERGRRRAGRYRSRESVRRSETRERGRERVLNRLLIMRLSVLLCSRTFHVSLLFSFTLLLTPLSFRGLLYSPLFSRSLHLERLSREFLSRNLQEAADALTYFRQRPSPSLHGNRSLASPHNISLPCDRTAARPLHSPPPGGHVPLAITIITTRRRPEYHYSLQVARGFLDRLSDCGPDCSRFRLLLCNVDPSPASHADACLLSHFLPSVERPSRGMEEEEEDLNRFEREKQDYAFCLSRTLEVLSPEYVLLAEDDAVPQVDFFRAFFELVRVRFPHKPLGGALYAKLYHPERLQGYLNPEPMRILEWFGLGSLAGLTLTWLYSRVFRQTPFSWRLFVAFAAYAMLLAELWGRHYLLELRRASPALYNVVPATECCTPAMLFSEASARRALGYLQEMKCQPGNAKDTALYRELEKRGERAWAVEPNMVTHVGMFSTLRGSMEDPQLL